MFHSRTKHIPHHPCAAHHNVPIIRCIATFRTDQVHEQTGCIMSEQRNTVQYQFEEIDRIRRQAIAMRSEMIARFVRTAVTGSANYLRNLGRRVTARAEQAQDHRHSAAA